MNTSYIATAVAIRDLKCYSIQSIDDRILLQKKIYLAQDIGLSLGYGYSWYIHGPYSTDLTTVAYQIVPEGTDAIEGKNFKEPYASMILKVNKLEDVIHEKELQIDRVQWYELLASMAYWRKHGYVKKEDMIKKVETTKPQFSRSQINAAYTAYAKFKSE